MNPSNRTPSELYDEMQPDYSASGIIHPVVLINSICTIVYDHGAISIAICRSNTQGSSKFFDRVTEKIEKHRELNVSGRHIRVRYVKERGIDGKLY